MAEIVLLGLFAIVVAVAWIFVILGMASTKRPNESPPSYKKLIDCFVVGVPHKWTYNNHDKLQCTACGVVAGEYSTDNGGY